MMSSLPEEVTQSIPSFLIIWEPTEYLNRYVALARKDENNITDELSPKGL